MRWVGGPLDGCVDEIARPTSVWIGPDISEPKRMVVIYLWYSVDEYRYSQDATDWANEQIRIKEEGPPTVT